MKWDVSYRDGEIEATVEAETHEEAIEKFLTGKVEEVTVNYQSLWPDFVEADLP